MIFHVHHQFVLNLCIGLEKRKAHILTDIDREIQMRERGGKRGELEILILLSAITRDCPRRVVGGGSLAISFACKIKALTQSSE